MKGSSVARRLAAVIVSVAANGVLLAFLLLDAARSEFAPPAEPEPTIQVELVSRRAEARAPRPTAAAEPAAPAAARAPGQPPTRSSPTSSPASNVTSLVPAPTPNGVRPTTPQVASPVDDPAAAAAKAGAALLRRLQDCSGRASADREREARCGARLADAPGIDRLSPERRAEFGAAGRRAEEQMETSAALQRSTFAPFAGASAARVGCSYRAGKWRCGTY